MKNKSEIGIIVLNWNNYDDTHQALEALSKSTYSNTKTLVIDNNSSDESTKKLQKQFPNFTYKYLKDNSGYSGGNNQGISNFLSKKVDYVLIMNNDVVLDPSCISNLVDYLAKHPATKILGPRIYSHSNREIFEMHGGSVNLFRSTSTPVWVNKKDVDKRYLKPYITKKLPGACLLVESGLIDKVGMMDEDFFLYYADADWLKRIDKLGIKQVVVPSAVAYHKVSATSGRNLTNLLYYDSRDFLRYIKKHYGLLLFVYSFINQYIRKLIKILFLCEGERIKLFCTLNCAYWDFLIGEGGRKNDY